jgi:aryl-alcohol dehydrogenase-like predicted oxidoreductase
LHWPERYTNTFGIRGFNPSTNNKWNENFQEILETLQEFIKIGKIRHVGLSNENPWGIMRFNELSKTGLPKMITVQNSYSLLNRTYEIGNSEISIQENIGLLAYSPLACGELTGKYIKGLDSKNSRLNLFKKFVRYSNENCKLATLKYDDLAANHNLSLTQMALAFVNSRPFVTSNIIGATNLTQLQENIDSIDVELSKEILNGIHKIHTQIPDPAC